MSRQRGTATPIFRNENFCYDCVQFTAADKPAFSTKRKPCSKQLHRSIPFGTVPGSRLQGFSFWWHSMLRQPVLVFPQHGRDLLVASHAAHNDHSSSTVDHSHTNNDTHANDSDNHSENNTPHHEESHEVGTPPPAWAVTPFVVLLGAIAILPLIPSLAHWWEKNSSKLLVAGILGGCTLAYYLFIHTESIEQHFRHTSLFLHQAVGCRGQ